MAYTINDLDDNGAVKPSLTVYILVVFLCRQLIYAPLSLLSSRGGRGGGARAKDFDLSFLQVTSIWEFAACAPAALMLFLLLKNRRGLRQSLRTTWLNGRVILVAGVFAQLFAQGFYYLMAGGELGGLGVVLLAAYGYCLVYLLTNTRIKDTFSQVPN